MKKIGIMMTGLLLVNCTTTQVYLVRHAEKGATPANNPPLTAVGEKRAMDLAKVLQDKGIQHVYSTNTLRTRSTAQPFVKQNALTIQSYSTDTLWEMSRYITKLPKGNILVVGHSNTILPLLDQFPVNHVKQTIPDSDYDNLFVVSVKKWMGRVYQFRLKETTFGEPAE
jgi:broad specificity phosphatase PhoE